MMIGTDCIGSYKSNYDTITNMTTPTIIDYNINLILDIYTINVDKI